MWAAVSALAADVSITAIAAKVNTNGARIRIGLFMGDSLFSDSLHEKKWGGRVVDGVVLLISIIDNNLGERLVIPAKV